MIDIVEEGVERLHPLGNPALQLAPFCRSDDARHDVERDQPFLAVVVAIDVEGDAGAAEEALGLIALLAQPAGLLFVQPLLIVAIGTPDSAIAGCAFHHSLQSNQPASVLQTR